MQHDSLAARHASIFAIFANAALASFRMPHNAKNKSRMLIDDTLYRCLMITFAFVSRITATAPTLQQFRVLVPILLHKHA
jgi:hypothetical protein